MLVVRMVECRVDDGTVLFICIFRSSSFGGSWEWAEVTEKSVAWNSPSPDGDDATRGSVAGHFVKEERPMFSGRALVERDAGRNIRKGFFFFFWSV